LAGETSANPAAVGERLTILLRHWLTEKLLLPHTVSTNDELPQQVIRLGPAGRGIGEMRDSYAGSLKIVLASASRSADRCAQRG